MNARTQVKYLFFVAVAVHERLPRLYKFLTGMELPPLKVKP